MPISPCRSPLLAFCLALLAVGNVVGARLLISPWVGAGVPFQLSFVSIAVTAWYGGLGPGLLARAGGAGG